MIRIVFLGTAASRPTVARNVSSIFVHCEGDLMLFDCGEGTQRQMMRYGTGFNIRDIFFTHLHGDHFLGVIGLLRTMRLQGREEPITLWGPPSSKRVLKDAVHLGVNRAPFELTINELDAGERVERRDYDILTYATRHGQKRSVGYGLIEHERPGRFHPERARALNIPEGPLYGRLQRGEAVEVDGRVIQPDEVLGPARPGRRIVFTGDTRPCRETVEIAAGADLLVHEATFSMEEAARARKTSHSTAAEAAEVARNAGVDRLVLTHISSRYATNARVLEREARKTFPATTAAYDGFEIEVEYRTDSEPAE